jgi:hypothetical protein
MTGTHCGKRQLGMQQMRWKGSVRIGMRGSVGKGCWAVDRTSTGSQLDCISLILRTRSYRFQNTSVPLLRLASDNPLTPQRYTHKKKYVLAESDPWNTGWVIAQLSFFVRVVTTFSRSFSLPLISIKNKNKGTCQFGRKNLKDDKSACNVITSFGYFFFYVNWQLYCSF